MSANIMKFTNASTQWYSKTLSIWYVPKVYRLGNDFTCRYSTEYQLRLVQVFETTTRWNYIHDVPSIGTGDTTAPKKGVHRIFAHLDYCCWTPSIITSWIVTFCKRPCQATGLVRCQNSETCYHRQGWCNVRCVSFMCTKYSTQDRYRWCSRLKNRTSHNYTDWVSIVHALTRHIWYNHSSAKLVSCDKTGAYSRSRYMPA